MRILLVSANREMLPDPVFPLGLDYVASALEERGGHEVSALDLCFVSDIDAAVDEAVTRAAPELVGVSIRNVDDVAYPRTTCYLAHYESVVAALRRATAAPIVVGGAGFTIMPAEFLEALDVDYGVVGEGEVAMVELADALGDGGLGSTLPRGVVTRRQPLTTPRREEGWGRIRPRRHHFSADDYYERGGMLNVQTRRGCPFRCAYCTYPTVEGRAVRLRLAEDVVDEVEAVVERTGVTHFFVVDSVFNHPRDYALAFCDELRGRRLGVSWTCYAHAGRMDGELVEAMREAGCEGVEFGTDALVDEVLEGLHKGFTFAEVAETSRLCRELDLRFCHFLFLGAPGEGPDEARLAIDRLASLEADSSIIMAGIRIFPGTALEERARAELGIERVGLEPIHYVSPRLVGHVEEIADRIIAEHPSWVIPGFRRNFDERIQRILRRSGKKGVLWDMLSKR